MQVRPSAFVSAKCAFAIILLTAAVTSAQTNTFPSSGNVGIGTLSPAAGLDVQMDSATANKLLGRFGNNNGSGGGAVRVYANTASNGTLYPAYELTDSAFWIASVAADRTTGLRFRTGINVGNGEANLADRMVVSPAGNVGIGTSAPGFRLDVQSNSQWAARFKKTDSTHGGILIDTATGFNPNIGFSVNGTIKWFMNSSVANGDSWNLYESTGTIARLTVTQAGNLGIGTTAPGFRLDVQSDAQWAARFKKTDSTHGGVLIDSASGFNPNLALAVNGTIKWYMNSNVANGDSWQLWESTGVNPRLTLTQAGNLGIGTLTPAKRLSVNGDIEVTGNIAAKYQDVAEWVDSPEKLAAGTVVVLDTTKSNQVISSRESYDPHVAGVISRQPGITLGESGESKVLVATTGRVKVKVDARYAPINIGDLLVTSDTPGMAMKSKPIKLRGREIHAPGTLIGKALEPLKQGRGEILVLLSLQ